LAAPTGQALAEPAGRTLTVGQGKAFATLGEAVAASRDGDSILIDAGVYRNDFATIDHRLLIRGVGGMAKLIATNDIPNGKAILITHGDVTLDHLEFAGARVADRNGAGIRYEGGRLAIRHCSFHDNQEGILGGGDPAGTITIAASEFADNGGGDGYTHAVYIGHIQTALITDSYFHDTRVGHHIKSRALTSTIRHNRIVDREGTASYDIDLPDGGVGVIADNLIAKGRASQNAALIHFGGEGPLQSPSSLLVEGNTLTSQRPGAMGVRNQTTIPVTLRGNRLYGLAQTADGPVAEADDQTLSAPPPLDLHGPRG
jgi:hypothetical protein